MGPTQNLHDFVLNLLTNPDARSAFEIDPEGTLHDAGLSDITVADVQDVVPLVVDYAPVQGITGLVPVGGDLGLGQGDLDPTVVIGQLESVAQQVTATASPGSFDVNAAVLGAISLDPAGFAGGSVLSGLGLGTGPVGVSVDSSGSADLDVADTLDSDIVNPVLADATGAVGMADGLVGDTVDGGALGATDFAAGTLTGSLGQVTGLVGSLGVTDTVGGLGSSLGVGDPLGGVTGTVGGVGDSLGVGDALDVGGLGSGVGGSALDGVNATSTVNGLTDQVGDTLDGVTSGVTGDLGLTGDATASTSGGLLGITDGIL